MKEVEKEIISNIIKIRIERGIKQATIASEIDIDSSTYSKIESGQVGLSIERLAQIAICFKMSIIDIIVYPKKYVNVEELSDEDKKKYKPKVLIQLELDEDKKEQVLKIIFGENNLEILNKQLIINYLIKIMPETKVEKEPQIITAEMKDAIIDFLLHNEDCNRRVDFDYKALSHLRIEKNNIERIRAQFVKSGLIEEKRGYGAVTIRAELHDFYQRGGFVVQEKLLKNNMEKLNLELEFLLKEATPNLMDRVNKIAGIASSITSIIMNMAKI